MVKTGLADIKISSPHAAISEKHESNYYNKALVLHRVLRSKEEYLALIARSDPTRKNLSNVLKLNRRGWTKKFSERLPKKYAYIFDNYEQNFEGFCHPTEKIGKNGIMQFTSYGLDLHNESHTEIVRVFKNMSNKDKINIVFTHASSKLEWQKFGNQINLVDKLYHIYPSTGNLVSASVPTAIHQAIESKSLQRGDNVALWVGSAGMSYNSTSFTY